MEKFSAHEGSLVHVQGSCANVGTTRKTKPVEYPVDDSKASGEVDAWTINATWAGIWGAYGFLVIRQFLFLVTQRNRENYINCS